jgi:hypothetical protein
VNESDQERFNRHFGRSLELPDDTEIKVTFLSGESGWFELKTVRMVAKGAPEGHTAYGQLNKAVAEQAMISFETRPAKS